MQREIKFRGMDTNGTMHYGRLSQDKENSTAYYKECSQRICWDNSNVPVTNKSLGQSIGIKDCNQTEVYEGDLLREYDTEDIYQVFYNNDSSSFEMAIPEEPGFLCGSVIRIDGISIEDDWEVIGNIFENPQLINN